MREIKCFSKDKEGRSYDDEEELTYHINIWSKFWRDTVNIISIQIIAVQAYRGRTSNFIGFVVYEKKIKT